MIADLLHNSLALYYAAALLMAVPVARIFIRAGFSPAWAALLGIPDAGLIACMALLALRKWPSASGEG